MKLLIPSSFNVDVCAIAAQLHIQIQAGPPPPRPPAPPPNTAAFVINVGGTEACYAPMQGSCNEDIGFPGLFIDGSHVAAGIKITSVMVRTATDWMVSFFLEFGKLDGTLMGGRGGVARLHCGDLALPLGCVALSY